MMAGSGGMAALVVEGGGMRGVFAAGVLNAFGSARFDPFDLYIGVSAGACNLASHLAGQNSRNFDIIERYSATSRFINVRRFLGGGSLMDLDWLWEVTMREYRLDLDRLFGRLRLMGKDFIVVATSMESGGAMYLRPDGGTLEHYLKVSSALPLLYRGRLFVGKERAADGGIADSIPVAEAHRRGASEITVIRTRPPGYRMKKSRIAPFYPVLFRKYPRFAGAIGKRAVSYNKSLEFIGRPSAGVVIREIAPPEGLDLGRLARDIPSLRTAYEWGIIKGYEFIKTWGKEDERNENTAGIHRKSSQA
ncbi:MAG: patatin family protein [Spirochaetes bacterium]|nr:patatin family protein [Spirochaetota bacterium]